MKLSNLFSNPLALAKYLFIALAALLVFLAFMSFRRVNSGDIGRTIQYATYAFMMFIDAAVMLGCAFGIGKKKKQFYQFSVAVLALNIILIFFYQLGFAEILFMALNAVTLYVLLAYRAEFTDSAAG